MKKPKLDADAANKPTAEMLEREREREREAINEEERKEKPRRKRY